MYKYPNHVIFLMDFSGAEQSEIDVRILIERIADISIRLSDKQKLCIDDFHQRIIFIETIRRKMVEAEQKIISHLEHLESHHDPEWLLFSNEEIQKYNITNEYTEYNEIKEKNIPLRKKNLGKSRGIVTRK